MFLGRASVPTRGDVSSENMWASAVVLCPMTLNPRSIVAALSGFRNVLPEIFGEARCAASSMN